MDGLRLSIVALVSALVIYSLWKMYRARYRYYYAEKVPHSQVLVWKEAAAQDIKKMISNDPMTHRSANHRFLHSGAELHGRNHIYRATPEAW